MNGSDEQLPNAGLKLGVGSSVGCDVDGGGVAFSGAVLLMFFFG